MKTILPVCNFTFATSFFVDKLKKTSLLFFFSFIFMADSFGQPDDYFIGLRGGALPQNNFTSIVSNTFMSNGNDDKFITYWGNNIELTFETDYGDTYMVYSVNHFTSGSRQLLQNDGVSQLYAIYKYKFIGLNYSVGYRAYDRSEKLFFGGNFNLMGGYCYYSDFRYVAASGKKSEDINKVEYKLNQFTLGMSVMGELGYLITDRLAAYINVGIGENGLMFNDLPENLYFPLLGGVKFAL